MLDLHRLALLHRFAVRGTIAAVAAETGYSASAVSQQLAALEREARATLLERSPRSAALTDAGRRLAAHATTLLDAMEAAEADLDAARRDSSGTVVVSSIPTAASVIAPGLTELDGPTIVLRQLHPADALERLRGHDIDVAVVDTWAPAPPRNGLIAIPLLTDPVVMAGARDAATWLCAPADQPSRQVADEVMTELGIEPVRRWEFEGLATIADLVAAGIGSAVVPRLATTRLDIDARPVGRSRRIEAVVRDASRGRRAVSVVLEALRGSFAHS